MSEYYDRQGNPTDLNGFIAAKADKRVAETMLPDCWVSTVFLGLDHQFGDGPPLIFETMVFPASDGKVDGWGELNCWRYSTEEQARAGHEAAVEWAREHAGSAR